MDPEVGLVEEMLGHWELGQLGIISSCKQEMGQKSGESGDHKNPHPQ